MNELVRLQEWFKSQCNGDWEHSLGVSITTCDNPGWWVKIDLAGTSLENKPFTPVALNVSPDKMERIAQGLEMDMTDGRGPVWMLCEVKHKVFHGAGDPDKLQTILNIFLTWAK